MLKIAIASLMFLVAGSAVAEEAPDSFSRIFAGLQMGWQQDRQTLGGATTSNGSNSSSGLAYGGQVGVDFRFASALVVGAEVALTGRTGNGVLDLAGNPYNVDQGRTIAATGRLGFLFSPLDLIYLRGGYANANYKLDDGTNPRISANRDGYTIGAGFERWLADRISARIEYGYSDFGSDSFFGGIAAPNTVAELKYRRHAVTMGVNFRF